MKLLFDFIPVILFFVAYKMSDFFIATAVAMAAVAAQMAYYWLRNHRLEIMQVFTFLVVVVLGALTLILHDEVFLKWKPTALNWFLALVFAASHFVARKPMIQMLMDQQIVLKPEIWHRLSVSWIAFFTLMGTVNLLVVYNFDTNTWVNFKLYGILGLTMVFVVLQAVFLSRHIDES